MPPTFLPRNNRFQKPIIRRKTFAQFLISCESIITLVSGLLLCFLILLGMSRTAVAQGRWIPTAGRDNAPAFVILQTERGESTCRKATAQESVMVTARGGGGPMRVIYPGAPRRKDMTAGTQTWAFDEAGGLTLQASAGLRIVLHGTSQLEQNQTAKNAFIVAANRWEAIISTPITVVIDVDFGTTFFGTPYPSANILGATGLLAVTGPYSDLRQRLINSASTTAEQQLYAALPSTAVPVDFNGAISDVTIAELSAPNARALGIIPDISDPNSLPLGQGDAGIGFNSNFQFDFSPDDGISSGLTDFDAVASHEIGHALGFISDAGDAASPVTVWDLFRFRPNAASLATFATAQRIMSIGGNQVFFGNQVSTFATMELSLSTGGSQPGPGDGDGEQSSHWKDDYQLSTVPYIGLMDPTLDSGLRRTISENDIMAIDLFGYSIGAPAPVRPINNNFVNAIAPQNNSGTLTGNNVSATREAGEPNHAGFTGDKSVWYYWLSPINGQMIIDTIGSNFDTTLAIYTGTAVNQLTTIAQNDDIVNGTNKVSRVQFTVTAGTTYRVAVDGWDGEFGTVTLNWNATGSEPTPTPTPTPSPSPTPTPPCLDDKWSPTSLVNAPSPRRLHTAIWTGSEMIIWGGLRQDGFGVQSGARYNPNTDSWTIVSTANAPDGRSEHAAVWTGSEMIIWGGFVSGAGFVSTGGRYNPTTDSWTPMTNVNAPVGRVRPAAVWTGTEMIVWGGSRNTGNLDSGGKYNPLTDTWTATNLSDAPALRMLHTGIWTGSEMIVWGGQNSGGGLNTGGQYKPATDHWTATNTTGSPSARPEHTAVWSGSEMIVWGGGRDNIYPNIGGRYKPGTDIWLATAVANAPIGRVQHKSVWTGSEMILWGGRNAGGFLQSGARYNPLTDTWIATCHQGAPTARETFTAVWTGTEMIVWGGWDSTLVKLDSGGRYSVQGPIQLRLEGSGPVLDQAAALNSSLFVRDPFPVINGGNLFNQGADRNTRVMLFASNLLILSGEASSAIVVNLVDSNNQSYDIPAEDVRAFSNFVQVTFRLPDGLAIGTCTVKIKAHGQVSNPGTIRIRT